MTKPMIEGRARGQAVVLDRDLLEGVTFLDLGASNGGSLRYCERRFGGRGLGIDNDPKKVATARSRGFNVICADAAEIEIRNAVRFVSAMDFFEHLPDVDSFRAILRSAAAAATDFLFIRHPSFESEGYLRDLGLCQYWHEWHGHTNHLRISDFCRIFDELGLNQYLIHFIGPIRDSTDPSILPAGIVDQHEYDTTRHGDKRYVKFDEPVWRMQHILIPLRCLPGSEWDEIVEASRR